jgi:hypothetical protein
LSALGKFFHKSILTVLSHGPNQNFVGAYLEIHIPNEHFLRIDQASRATRFFFAFPWILANQIRLSKSHHRAGTSYTLEVCGIATLTVSSVN